MSALVLCCSLLPTIFSVQSVSAASGVHSPSGISSGASSGAVSTSPTSNSSGATSAAASTAANLAEAERLYSEAVEFYQAERYARACQLGHECCVLAPRNARYRTGLAVFESKYKALLYSLASAKEAVRLAPNDPNALTNYGSLLQKNGQRQEAVERYKKAETINANDYRPRLGIAQCLSIDGADGLVIAERELKTAFDNSEDSMAKWASLGETYFILRHFNTAAICFSRALKVDPKNYYLQTLRLKAALAERDNATIRALTPDVLSDKLMDRDVALGLALLPDNEFSPDFKNKLLIICQHNFIGQAEFFYQLGRRFESSAHLDMAYQAYQQALHYSPGECLYIVSEIGNRLSAGRNDEAITIWGQSSAERAKPLASGNLPRDNSVFAHVLTSIGELLQTDNAGVHILHAKFKNIKCGCRLPVIQVKLVSQPGVIFARMEDAKDYPFTIVYDAKKTAPDTIFKHVRKEEDVIEVISDSPVQSIPELVQLIQTASDKTDKHIFSLWSFMPPLLELPK